jgi:hypothetical protein
MGEQSGKAKRPIRAPGDWQAELLGTGSVHFGGVTNQSPSPHAIEFSFITLPAIARGPEKIELPAVIVLMAPAEPLTHEWPGSLMRNGLVTLIDLFVSRSLFSDLLPRIESRSLTGVRFRVEEGNDQNWPISSWSIGD